MWSRRAQSGDQYCTGGSFSGEICGWTVDAAGVDRYVSGKWKRSIVVSSSRQGWCIRSGESGGAVYTVNSNGSVAAKGIHSSSSGGGSDFYGGALDPCEEQFTDIWDAYYGFPGTLKTQ
jgi:streptogrisin C